MDEETIFSMINLKVRTEYSFRKAYGKLSDIIKNTKQNALGIADFGTWGWVKFKAECEQIQNRYVPAMFHPTELLIHKLQLFLLNQE